MSEADHFLVREATVADMPGISRVRLSVRENALSVQQLTERGITNASVAASLLTHRRGWIAERDAEIVAFAMADKANWSIFALFVLPEYEGRGLGSRLLEVAVDWLWESGAGRLWLSTSPNTRAASFYARQGWVQTGAAGYGDVRFEMASRQRRR